MKDKEHLTFLDPSNDYEKCLNSFSENIPKIVRETPGISTFEVLQRETKRAIKYFNVAPEKVRYAITMAIANNLGETIQCSGKAKKIEGRYYQQLEMRF